MAAETVLYDRHVSLGARMVDFGGWLLPVQYEGILAEHRHCRTSAAVFDTSHMRQLVLCGPDAAAQFARIGTQDARIVNATRAARAAVAREAALLARLEQRDRALVAQVLAQRNQVAAVQDALLREQISELRTRSGEAARLGRWVGQLCPGGRRIGHFADDLG